MCKIALRLSQICKEIGIHLRDPFLIRVNQQFTGQQASAVIVIRWPAIGSKMSSPCPLRCCKLMLPPWAARICRTMVMPMPVPKDLVVKNGSKISTSARNARAGVGNFQSHRRLVGRSGEQKLAARRHRLDGVLSQVQDHLFHLVDIDAYFRQVRGESRFDFHAALGISRQLDLDRFGDQLGQTGRVENGKSPCATANENLAAAN